MKEPGIKHMRVLDRPPKEGLIPDTGPVGAPIQGVGEGRGPDTWACGRCSTILIQDVFPDFFHGNIRCPVCKTWNTSL